VLDETTTLKTEITKLATEDITSLNSQLKDLKNGLLGASIATEKMKMNIETEENKGGENSICKKSIATGERPACRTGLCCGRATSNGESGYTLSTEVCLNSNAVTYTYRNEQDLLEQW